ncbi:cation:proton antiporter [Roseibium marinum]|uniref:CPA1 family monovalent cation:H+ antiporter n=1 Tax=Roseibium marinum TaxID=281252 RepID=A0A2S3V595_9HYPH|nr:cation:proton antiporter [Roseibium marinum]POF34849.1 CPA1 family monovalent cation:H+ antiporter [Roseibium marinum]
METPLITGAFALLLITISLLQPLARRLGIASSVLLAMVGTLIGILAIYLLYTPRTDAFNTIANVFVHPPLDSEMILYIFLPILLFQTALTLDIRRILEDIAPILVMAVVAVFVATFFIGFALYPLSGMSLIACLLLGAIVATTDPVAVVAIFRDIGAPARLGRIVEGESLLNDAAAIVIFVLLIDILTGEKTLTVDETVLSFLRSFAGGVIVGTVLARLAVSLLPMMRDLPLAQVTLSLALPYGTYVFSDQFADVSAVVAVVCAGTVFNLYGPARIQPSSWQFLHAVWEQISFWAASLIFLLSAILIPRFVEGFSPIDILLLLVVIVAALAARAVVIFGLLPMLSTLGAGQSVNNKFKTVMLWGGMRGAVTLTLALSVSEHSGLSHEVSGFVTKLATGFVLFTLLVYGTSLKPLIRLLGLDRLNARDEAVRTQFLALALSDVRHEIQTAAGKYHIEPRVTGDVIKDYAGRSTAAAAETNKLEELKDWDRVRIGLVALADREQQLVLEHFHDKTISGRSVSRFLALTGRTGDLTRSDGRSGYNAATRQPLKFGLGFRLAQMLQRHFRITRPLAIRLADRFEFLLVYRILADELIEFNDRRIRPLLGDRIAGILKDTLNIRREETVQAIEALRLQYPDYADALENQFLRKAGVRLEEKAYDDAKGQMLIGTELHRNLLREVEQMWRACHTRPKLDLGLKTRELISAHPLFVDLPRKQQKAIQKTMRPQFATPGEKLIRKGDRGDAAYFIASGAVEVRAPTHNVRLGRGDVFGEIALMTGGRRSADVYALGYCQLLSLKAQDFKKLMEEHPGLRDHVSKLAIKRQLMNTDPDGPEFEDPVVSMFAKTPDVAAQSEKKDEPEAQDVPAQDTQTDIGVQAGAQVRATEGEAAQEDDGKTPPQSEKETASA